MYKFPYAEVIVPNFAKLLIDIVGLISSSIWRRSALVNQRIANSNGTFFSMQKSNITIFVSESEDQSRFTNFQRMPPPNTRYIIQNQQASQQGYFTLSTAEPLSPLLPPFIITILFVQTQPLNKSKKITKLHPIQRNSPPAHEYIHISPSNFHSRHTFHSKKLPAAFKTPLLQITTCWNATTARGKKRDSRQTLGTQGSRLVHCLTATFAHVPTCHPFYFQIAAYVGTYLIGMRSQVISRGGGFFFFVCPFRRV